MAASVIAVADALTIL